MLTRFCERRFTKGSHRALLASTASLILGCSLLWIGGCGGSGSTPTASAGGGSPASIKQALGAYVVLGYNDLGMHCMNNDFSDLCVLPPANTLRATVIKRGSEPQITTSGVTVSYSIPGNTSSSTKINFWNYANALFGATLPNDVGLFGFGLQGNMQATTAGDFWAHGIPLTPITDAGVTDPYQLALINVMQNGSLVASTQAVTPVSWEMSCNNCHNTPGMSVTMDILTKHDRLSGTDLVNHRPVLCASCHADPALGTTGVAGVPTLSSSMHAFHAPMFKGLPNTMPCYSCHPGPQTQCLRDVHRANGMTCYSCHTSMEAVGDPSRKPWVDEPRCGDCHHVAGHQYEQPGVLFRDSVGHNGVKCIACHGSPHAITPSMNPRDNVQAIALQGVAGPIGLNCTVCHTSKPSDPFNHTRGD